MLSQNLGCRYNLFQGVPKTLLVIKKKNQKCGYKRKVVNHSNANEIYPIKNKEIVKILFNHRRTSKTNRATINYMNKRLVHFTASQ